MSAAKVPFTSAARNAVWVYPRVVPPRFSGAPEIVETYRSCEMPDVDALLPEAGVAVELYGGAKVFRLDGVQHRVYIEKFDFVSYTNERAAREGFKALWRAVERLNSLDDVMIAAVTWREEQLRIREERRVT